MSKNPNPNPNQTGGKTTTQQRFDDLNRELEHVRAQLAADQAAADQAAADAVAAQERRRQEAARLREKAEQRKNLEEPGKSSEERLRTQEKGRKEATAPATGETSLSQKPGTRCAACTMKNRDCTWNEAAPGNKAKTCDSCRRLKDKCVLASVPPAKAPSGKSKGGKRLRAEVTPSPKGKAKRRQRSPVFLDDDIEEIPNPDVVVVADELVDYNDLGWAVAANNIVGELTWMNELLEKSVDAAESSRVAMERSSAAMERFLTQQKTFQAMLLEGLKSGFQGTVDENPKEAHDNAPSAGDVEMDT
ncbi:hypothetical protein F4604DRAFT_1935439 [Suillus subluteus]|nr:hypothetical protein F4604DRAFT_1935439 [Suillus subluteus]